MNKKKKDVFFHRGTALVPSFTPLPLPPRSTLAVLTEATQNPGWVPMYRGRQAPEAWNHKPETANSPQCPPAFSQPHALGLSLSNNVIDRILYK